MTTRRAAAGTLVAALLLFVIAFALREAGEFERISGVTRSGHAEGEPTLRGTGAEALDALERGPTVEAPGAARDASGPWIVRGRVVDLGLRPVAGVPIVVGAPRTDGGRSGADGAFTWRTDEEFVWLRPGAGWIGSIQKATRDEPAPTLQVVRLLPLQVTVLDVAGRPVAGLSGRVTHAWIEQAGPSGHTQCEGSSSFGPTDAHGRCELPLAAATESLTLEVTEGDAGAQEDVAFPFARDVTLRLRPRLLIRGEVVDETGGRRETCGTLFARSLDPARTTVRYGSDERMEELFDDLFRGGEDPAGETETAERPPQPFRLTVGGAGPWLVHFESDLKSLADSASVLVTAPAENVRLVCPDAVSISGRVLDLPHAGYEARWLPASTPGPGRRRPASTDIGSDGAFSLPGLAPGPGRLFVRCRADDRYALLEDVQAPLEGVQVRLVEGLSLAGRFDEAPAPPDGVDATLWILAEDDGLRVTATVQPDGTWRIRGLPPGRYELSWRWTQRWGGTSGPWAPFGVTVDLGPETGEIVLPAPR